MKKQTKQDWRRPGARVNMYFADPETPKRLARIARQHKMNRSELVLSMLDTHPHYRTYK